MEKKRQKVITIACRFIPYDQWFVTHVDPRWKIKHVKQIILAKCFSLPFDVRKLVPDTPGDRPPSPITFAPEEGERPDSPIEFARIQDLRKKRSSGKGDDDNSSLFDANSVGDHDGEGIGGDEGYEEDDEWDDEEDGPEPSRRSPIIKGGRVEIPSASIPTSPTLEHPSRTFSSVGGLLDGPNLLLAQPQQQEPSVNTDGYILIRFSTGQILEEDYAVSWYDILSRELVELHASFPPAQFQATMKLPHLLMEPVWRPDYTEPPESESRKSDGKLKQNDPTLVPPPLLGPPPPPSKPKESDITNPNLLAESLTLTYLPRHNLKAYAEPYWEGWVRALRVKWVADDDMPPAGGSSGSSQHHHQSYQAYGAGMMNFSNSMGSGMGLYTPEPEILLDLPHHRHRHTYDDARNVAGSVENSDRYKIKYEWRQRWVVICGGVFYLCKTRDDFAIPYQLPLSSLLSLQDASHLQTAVRNKPGRIPTTRQRSNTSSRVGDRDQPSLQRRTHRRSISAPRSSTPTVTPRDPRAHMDLSTNALTSPSRSKTMVDIDRSGAGARSTSDQYHGRAGPSRAISTASLGVSVAHSGSSKSRVEAEMQKDRERREKEKEKQREKEKRRREAREQEKRDMEYLAKWDDIGFGFGRSNKSKEKEKEKEKEKAKGKEKEKEGERKRRDREKDKEREKWDPEYEAKRREKRKKLRNSRFFIPNSKEEAEEIGLKIVCAKFMSPPRDLKQNPRPAPWPGQISELSGGRRYTSTGPTLAGEISYVSSDTEQAGQTDKGHTTDDVSQFPYAAVRKASFPSLTLGKSSVLSNVSTTPSGGGSTANSSSSKFGIGGLFGKDKGAASDRELEKEEKRKEEKDRKSKEKKENENKGKDKGKVKLKKEDNTVDEDEGTMSSTLGWKLGKRHKPKDYDGLTVAGPSLAPSHSVSTLLNESQSLKSLVSVDTASTLISRGDEEKKPKPPLDQAPSTYSSRPKLTLSPLISRRAETTNGHNSDSGSSLSLSSPVFAHSTDSEELDDDIYRYERRGYRYGGYYERKLEREQKGKGRTTLDEADLDTTGRDRVPRVGVIDPRTDVGHKNNKGKGHEPPVSVPRQSIHAQDGEEPLRRQRNDEREKRKQLDRGEWIVLDMGNEQAYHSILRVLHRYYENPAASTFIPQTLGSLFTSDSTPFNLAEPRTPTHDTSSTFYSSANSPAQGIFPLHPNLSGTAESYSGTSSKKHDTLHQSTQSDTDDVNTRSKSKKTASRIPGLQYPEWRRRLVQRASMHGMRENARPLDLVLNGWNKEFHDMGLQEKLYRRQQRKREQQDKEGDFDDIVKGTFEDGSVVESHVQNQEDVQPAIADDFQNEPQEAIRNISEYSERRRRLSQLSYVSTLNAGRMNAEVHTVHFHGSASEDECDDHWQDDSTSTIDVLEDNEYQPDEHIDMNLDSFDESSEEESEVEWIAWMTDLPRQVAEREQERRREIERIKERRRFETLLQDRHKVEDSPLSPIVFSNPFRDSSSFAESIKPVSTDDKRTLTSASALSLHQSLISVPRTPAEERTMYQEERQMLEPMAVSFPPPPPSSESSNSIYSNSYAASSSSTFQSWNHYQPTHTQVTVTKTTVLHDSNYNTLAAAGLHPLHAHYSQISNNHSRQLNSMSSLTTLSSPSSNESLSLSLTGSHHVSGMSMSKDEHKVSISSVSKTTKNRISSPLPGISSVEGFGNLEGNGNSGMIPTPTSSVGHYPQSISGGLESVPLTAAERGSVLSANINSRQGTIIGGSSRTHRLHHSTSMPLSATRVLAATTTVTLPLPPSSVPSSPPRSPTTPRYASTFLNTTSTTSGSASALTTPGHSTGRTQISQPLALGRPILSPAQINQIDSETEFDLSSSPPRYISPNNTSIPVQLTTPAPFSYKPSSVAVGTFSNSGSYVPGSIAGNGSESRGRVTNISTKANTAIGGGSERSEPTRGVLRKRLSVSDVGKQTHAQGNVGDFESGSSPNSGKTLRQRPKLSLHGLGGSSGSGSTSSSVTHAQRYQDLSEQVHSPTTSYQRVGIAMRSPTAPNAGASAEATFPQTVGTQNISTVGSSSSGTMASLLRRVRSGSSLSLRFGAGDDGNEIVGSSPPLPMSPIASASASGTGTGTTLDRDGQYPGNREISPGPPKKKKSSTMEKIVKRF